MNETAPIHNIGSYVPMVDGPEKVSGRAKYTADILAPGMLAGRILRSPHAHARITRIDTSKAVALPGVIAAVTHEDAPDLDWEAAWFNYRGHILDGRARFVGDEVAAVAAVDEATAEAALELI